MFKFVGAAFVIAAGWLAGSLLERNVTERIGALSSIIPALSILKAEIENLMTPIPEAFEALSDSASYPASGIFSGTCALMNDGESFADAFSEIIRDNSQRYGLFDEDAAVLTELAPVLGRYSAAEQAARLSQAVYRLQEQLNKAYAEHKKNGKLYKTMGLMLGFLLVIVTL
ncbi:MAG: stage III sporulation protein AB [Bacillota bacterium]|nr:stage III sporulation protein AB [Bacillota bacterium]